MGYYTGNGVVTGGGSTTSVLLALGPHNWFQKDEMTTTVKNGVSLSVAQSGATSDSSLNVATQGAGGVTYYCLGYGSRSESTYTRISDSNLYVLTTTSHTLKCKLDSNGWIG